MKDSKWSLDITPDQYDAIYRGISGMADQKVLFHSEATTDEEYIMTYLTSKLWRMNKIYTIINKVGDKCIFRMNLAQHVKYAQQLRHPRVMVLKSRQRGISTGTLVDYNDDALFIDSLTVGMQSYGLEESSALLEKLTVIWENFDEGIKDFLGLGLVKNNTKSMAYSNGSEVKVQTSFRGSTLHRLHVSELGKIANKDPKKAKELKSGTLQAIKAGMPVTIESTAEGQHNAFHEWWTDAVDIVGERSLKDFHPLFLSWVDDPDCQMVGVSQLVSASDKDEITVIQEEYGEYAGIEDFRLSEEQIQWFVAQRRELDVDFYQEYPHTPESAFNAVHDGTYYARLWRERGHVVSDGLYDSALDTHIAMDLGMNDMMCLVFFQIHGRELRIVDEYHNFGEGLEHYADLIKGKGYNIGSLILPHDAKVKELTTGMTRVARLRELGFRNIRVLKRTSSVQTDIEQVRKAIPFMWIDATTCGYLLRMIGRYSKKWDDALGTFKEKPLHDEWSNPADALRYVIMSNMFDIGPEKVKKKKARSVGRTSIAL